MTNAPDGAPDSSGRQRTLKERPAWERELLSQIGTRIRAARKERELTIASLAETANLDAAYLGEVERGRVNISVTTLACLALALGVEVVRLIPDPQRPLIG